MSRHKGRIIRSQEQHRFGDLFGFAVAPGFTGDIFEGGRRETLLKLYPDRAEDINKLSVNKETKMPDGFAK